MFDLGTGLAGALPRRFVDFFTAVGTVAERTGDRLRKTLGDGISISMCLNACSFVDEEKNRSGEYRQYCMQSHIGSGLENAG